MNKVQHINPGSLVKNPAFSQIVVTQGSGKTIYIGGQNSVNANQEIIGKNDFKEQTRQTMMNIENALMSCGATFQDLVKLNIYIVQGQNLLTGFQVSQEFFKTVNEPPSITVLFVAGLANPEFLIEIDAIAFLPD